MLDSFEAVRADGTRRACCASSTPSTCCRSTSRASGALDVIASMQPSHCTADLELADQIIGPRRLASYAWRSFLDAGVRLAFGSDAPGRGPEPVLRPARRGDPAARRRLSRSAAGGPRSGSRSTRPSTPSPSAAHESVGRTDVGRLVPGQLADLVVVDRDLWALEQSAAAEIRDTVVLQTWVGGELAFERS